MIKMIAKIKLYTGNQKRRTGFTTGYRPLFNFVSTMKTSGYITLIDRQYFLPGDEGIVEVKFLTTDYLGEDFGVGKLFSFDEGGEILGEGSVLEIIPE